MSNVLSAHAANYYKVEEKDVVFMLMVAIAPTLALINLVVAIYCNAGFFGQFDLTYAVVTGGLSACTHLAVALGVSGLLAFTNRYVSKKVIFIELLLGFGFTIMAYGMYESVISRMA